MHIDLKTVTIEPLRQTFSHLERRFGNKPASRYQEATYDIQAVENLHYRPTWAPGQRLYDPDLSKIRMADWYVLKDPRQFYYHTYTITRARQQETTEANFEFVQSRQLLSSISDDLRDRAKNLLIPLRHAAWGANLVNMFIAGYGYGVALTQPCIMQAMDNLGIAQYLSKLALLLDGEDALDAGKVAWTDASEWQGLRKYVEDSLVVRDPIEVFVAQNVVIDGLLYPLVYHDTVDGVFAGQGGSSISMLTQFMSQWSDETRKWVDAVMKAMAKESAANQATLSGWVDGYVDRAMAALKPVARIGLRDAGEQALEVAHGALRDRMSKAGVAAR